MSTADRFWFLFAAYAAIWLLLASFLVRLGRRHRALERELERLRRSVDAPTSRSAAPPASRD